MEETSSRSVDGEKVQEQLRFTLSSVNDWLKFAEAKNAALVATNIGAAFGAFRLASTPNLCPLPYYYALVAGGFLLLGSGISLASFIPHLEIPALQRQRSIESQDSILFYGHIASCSSKSYLEQLYTKNGVSLAKVDPLEKDYAEQIVVNSRIALQKYRWFNHAARLTLLALAPPVFILVMLVQQIRRL